MREQFLLHQLPVETINVTAAEHTNFLPSDPVLWFWHKRTFLSDLPQFLTKIVILHIPVRTSGLE